MAIPIKLLIVGDCLKKGYTREISLLRRIITICLIVFFDLLSCAISYNIVETIFNVAPVHSSVYLFNFLVSNILPVAFLTIFGAYKFKNLKNFFRLIYLSAFSLFISFGANIVLDYIFFKFRPLRYLFYYFISSFVCIISLRLVYFLGYRIFFEIIKKHKDYLPTIIVGAGFSGRMVYNELYNYRSNLVPICFVDDDENKIGSVIQNIRVFGPTVIIPEIVKKYDVKVIVFAIPNCKEEDKKRILKYCAETDCDISIIPSRDELLNKKHTLKSFSKIDIASLMDRDEIVIENDDLKEKVEDKVCLITGAGGSIGSELCRQILRNNARKVVLLDISENSVLALEQELVLSGFDKNKIKIEISSVRDESKLEELFKKYSFDYVFHAAAHKHVPLMENAPEEAIKNNCLATYYLAKLCHSYNVKSMIFISTDKAGQPDNIMAASKRVSEILLKYFNKISECEFKSIRFGNVLGSNGSVIQLFLRQIEKGGPVTVTHPEIVRYFMTIPESVSLILKTLSIKSNNNIYILDMGKPVKILTLAENLITMCGYIPYEDIDIQFSGLRPGETLNEKCCIKEEFFKTDNDKIYEVNNIDFDFDKFLKEFDLLVNAANSNDSNKVVSILNNII